jgi:hypothetical protein
LRVAGATYVWRTGPMGWAPMVTIAQSASELLAWDPLSGATVLVYIDNIVFFGTQETCSGAWRRMQDRLRAVKCIFDETSPVATEGTVLGIKVNLTHKTLALSEKFIAKLTSLATNLDIVPALTHREVWKIFGCIVWACSILDVRMCQFPRFWFWLLRRAKALSISSSLWDLKVIWNTQIREDLLRLLELLLLNKPHSVEPTAASVELYVDASGIGIGAVLSNFDAVWNRPLKVWEQSRPISFNELVALEEGLSWARKRLGSIPLKVYTDSTNVRDWVRAGKAPTFSHCQVLERVLALRPFELCWISTKCNLADAPSRSVGSRIADSSSKSGD